MERIILILTIGFFSHQKGFISNALPLLAQIHAIAQNRIGVTQKHARKRDDDVSFHVRTSFGATFIIWACGLGTKPLAPGFHRFSLLRQSLDGLSDLAAEKANGPTLG